MPLQARDTKVAENSVFAKATWATLHHRLQVKKLPKTKLLLTMQTKLSQVHLKSLEVLLES